MRSRGFGAAFRVDASRDDQADLAPAFTFAVGGELDHHPTRTITVAARLGVAAFDNDDGSTAAVYNLAAVAGWHWF